MTKEGWAVFSQYKKLICALFVRHPLLETLPLLVHYWALVQSQDRQTHDDDLVEINGMKKRVAREARVLPLLFA